MHPDFVFFHEVGGKIVASILDPHGHHLDDALMKLKALARFAGTYGEAFHRIEALAEVDRRCGTLTVAARDGASSGRAPDRRPAAPASR